MEKVISILGCGWLGESLAERLHQQGYQIKGSTTSENKLQRLASKEIEPYLINLASLSSTISAFLESEVLIIAVPPTNIDIFKNLLFQIEKSQVKKIVFISSTSVYDNSKEILTEQSPLKSSLLAEMEQLFKSNPLFSTTIVRFGGLFGYNRKPGNFFPKGKKIGNPEGFVNMIHKDDCISIIERIIQKNIWNEILNGCADTHPTRREFYTKAAFDAGQDVPDFEESDSNDYKIISNQKLKTLLNFEFKYPDLMDINQGAFDYNL